MNNDVGEIWKTVIPCQSLTRKVAIEAVSRYSNDVFDGDVLVKSGNLKLLEPFVTFLMVTVEL